MAIMDKLVSVINICTSREEAEALVDDRTEEEKKKQRIESLVRQQKTTQAIAALKPSRAAPAEDKVHQRLQDLDPQAGEDYSKCHPAEEKIF